MYVYMDVRKYVCVCRHLLLVDIVHTNDDVADIPDRKTVRPCYSRPK